MSDLRGARRPFLPRQTGEGINPFSFTKKWLWLQHGELRVTGLHFTQDQWPCKCLRRQAAGASPTRARKNREKYAGSSKPIS